MPGDFSEREPPDPISNSEVKTFSADDSVGLPHVKVGHCQALIQKERLFLTEGPFFLNKGLSFTYLSVANATVGSPMCTQSTRLAHGADSQNCREQFLTVEARRPE